MTLDLRRLPRSTVTLEGKGGKDMRTSDSKEDHRHRRRGSCHPTKREVNSAVGEKAKYMQYYSEINMIINRYEAIVYRRRPNPC